MKQTLHINGQPTELENLQKSQQSVRFELNGTAYHFRSLRLPDGMPLLEREVSAGVWQRVQGINLQTLKDGSQRLQLGRTEAKVAERKAGSSAHSEVAPLSPLAPMPGLVRQIIVKAGDKVTAGQPVAIIEAMKLQTTLSAGGEGVVEAVLVQEGSMIPEGTELVRIKPAEAK